MPTVEQIKKVKKLQKLEVFKCLITSASKTCKKKMDNMFVQFKTELLKPLVFTENSSVYEVPRTAKRIKLKR